MQNQPNANDSFAPTFEHSSIIPSTLDAVWAFHADKGAFSKLTPPPMFVQVHRNELKSLTEGEVEFTLWFLFFPVRWIARHEPGPTPNSFQDRQIKGPVEVWLHRHLMETVPGGVKLTDQITIHHRKSGFWAIFSRLFFNNLALRGLFIYRHLRTRLGAKRYAQQTAKV